jgi:hypothetical protein
MASSWCFVGGWSVGPRAVGEREVVSAGLVFVGAPLLRPQAPCWARLVLRGPGPVRMGTTGRGGCAPDVLASLDKARAGEGGIVGAVSGGGGCRDVLVLVGMACAVVFMAAVVQAVACEVGCAVRCLRLRAQLWFFSVADWISPHPGRGTALIPRRAWADSLSSLCHSRRCRKSRGLSAPCQRCLSAPPLHTGRRQARQQERPQLRSGSGGLRAGCSPSVRSPAVGKVGSGVDCGDDVAAPRIRTGAMARVGWRRAWRMVVWRSVGCCRRRCRCNKVRTCGAGR